MVDIFELISCVASEGLYLIGSKTVEHIGYTGLISLYLTFRDFYREQSHRCDIFWFLPAFGDS